MMASSTCDVDSIGEKEEETMIGNGKKKKIQFNGQKRKTRSVVWLEFERGKNELGEAVGFCIYCKEPIKARSGTTSMKNHLKRCIIRKQELGQQENGDGSPSFRNAKFNQETSRRDVSKMIAKHAYPFNMVDHAYFREFVKNLQPLFDLKHRTTTTSDVIKLYKDEKKALYTVLNKNSSRISLTTDLWTAGNTRDAYMCITGHFVDEDWILREKILMFRKMESGHTGEDLSRVMMKCLLDWNIDKKLFSITLDNASANGSMIAKLKADLNEERLLVSNGDFFHIRCASHILNLIVKDGLAKLGNTLDNIRESCKYVRSNPLRKLDWKEAIAQVNLTCQREVCVDCPTRWNSTYDMLQVAGMYKEAFKRLAKKDQDFKVNPTDVEWEQVEIVCNCLKVFRDSTETLSGFRYPTSDLYFSEVCEIHIHLKELMENGTELVKGMADNMMKKFKKYWNRCSLILAVAFVLNPGYKLKFVNNYYLDIYGENTCEAHTKRVRKALMAIYKEYVSQTTNFVPTNQPSTSTGSSGVCEIGKKLISNKNKRIANWYHREGIDGVESKSELDLYLEEPLFLLNDQCLLEWWKVNSPKYPTLSKMARDILSIPVTSVPSESAFSFGGRVLNDHRASLDPKTVEALLCTQNR